MPGGDAGPASRARLAIVTGSESGIGRATALALARGGCGVGVTWHDDERAGATVAPEIEPLGRRAGRDPAPAPIPARSRRRVRWLPGRR